VRVAGLENFERAVRENKGVILATAHFGNFPLMAIAGSYLVGPVTFMMNPNLDPGLRTLIETGMSRFGNRALFRGDAVDKIEEILNKKETLCLLMDQRGGKEEYWVDVALLGRRFRFNSGPAFLAFRFGSPVVPVYNFRHKDGSYEIRYGRPISIVHTEDEAEDLKTNMGRMAQTLEAAILESPDHWLFWGWKGFADDFRVGNDDSLVFQKVEYAKREVGKN
jgi:KDO2-lipid IV(A) lauroyltransferase